MSQNSFEKAKKHLEGFGLAHKVKVFDVSSATVALAAEALGCAEQLIAKSLSFNVNGKCVLIVAAGDARVNNSKFKARFGCKASMLPREETEEKLGFAAGGVCPFGVKEGVEVYLDESLKRFHTVYPAVGSSNSAVELTISELETASGSLGWVDVTKLPEE